MNLSRRFVGRALWPLLMVLVVAACNRSVDDAPNLSVAADSSLFAPLSATLNPGAAEFHFSTTGGVAPFHVDISTQPDMAWDVYGAFGAGDSSPITVLDPQARWDKYRCGETLYWRIRDSTGAVGDIQTAEVCPANPFSDLSAALNLNQANFTFAYAGEGTTFTITASTRPDMEGGVVGTVAGKGSPIKLRDPQRVWPTYRCGTMLYWRVTDNLGVSSAIQQKHVCGSVGFSAESAMLTPDKATFAFRYRGDTNHFRVDISTVADMSRDVFVGFGTGQSSPITVSNPQWDKYRCGATLYWRVLELLNGVVGEIQTAVVACPAGP